jgi:polysaccharide biosynthesis/export protein
MRHLLLSIIFSTMLFSNELLMNELLNDSSLQDKLQDKLSQQVGQAQGPSLAPQGLNAKDALTAGLLEQEEVMFYRQSELIEMDLKELLEAMNTILLEKSRRELLDIFYANLSILSNEELSHFSKNELSLNLHPSTPRDQIITQVKRYYIYKKEEELASSIGTQFFIHYLNDTTFDTLISIVLFLQQKSFELSDYEALHNDELSTVLTDSAFNPFYKPNVEEMITEIKANQIIINEEKLERFSSTFFSNQLQEGFNNAINDDYIISVGDTLNLTIFGTKSRDERLQVNNEGNVIISDIGSIAVAGQTYHDIKNLIEKKAKHSFSNSTAILSISDVAPVTVTLSGEVNIPGNHILEPYSHLKDALIKANGVSEIGSVRMVQLIRQNKKIAIFDLYELILNGEPSDDLVLKNGDIIHVPIAQRLVNVYGAVKKSAIYELKDKETTKELILYAGGLKSDAYVNDIYLLGERNHQKKIYQKVSLNEQKILEDGDQLFIGELIDRAENRLYLYGNVLKPGAHHFNSGDTLNSFFKRQITAHSLEGLFLADTILDYFVIKRLDTKTLKREIISGNLSAIINNTSSSSISLQEEDELYFFNNEFSLANTTVNVVGEVKRAGKFNFFKGMTLLDLLYTAGLKPTSYQEKIIVLNDPLSQLPKLNFYSLDEAHTIKLQSNDEIRILSKQERDEIQYVSLLGAVNHPGKFRYTKNLTFNDLANQANGLSHQAYKTEFELSRYEINEGKRAVKIYRHNVEEALKENLVILPDDEIFIYDIPNWNNTIKVTLEGEVNFPGTYSVAKGEKLADIIKRAGGYTDDAFLFGAVYTREDVKVLQQVALERQKDDLNNILKSILATANSKGNTQTLSLLETLKKQLNDVNATGRISIDLPAELEELEKSIYNISLKDKDRLFIPKTQSSLLVVGEVFNPTSIIYNPEEESEYFIERAGGVTHNADEDNIFIVHANGESEQLYRGLFRSNAKVRSGDLIVVPLDFSLYNTIQLTRDLTDILYKLAFSTAALKNIGAF